MEVSGLEGCSSVDIHAQLSRVLASDAFRRSTRLGRFLSYLIECALAGERDGIKEYRLALDVFDRGEDFDPRTDTIVRVQARNLRARLDDYYQNPSSADTIRFAMAKGAYAIQFETIERAPAPAIESAAIPEVPAVPGPPPGMSGLTIAIVGIVAIAAIAGAIYYAKHRATAAAAVENSANTLFVSPFVNLSSDPDNEYFARGLTEELTDALANLPGLRVVARTPSTHPKDKELDFANLQQLGVANVLEGSIRKTGTRVRISARLIQVASGANLWSSEYDREIQDSIVTEQEIADSIAATLKLRLAHAGQRLSSKMPDPDAYDLYLKGLYSWHLVNPDGASKGIRYLERSIEIDPTFAPAYVALAGCYGALGIYYRMPPADAYVKIRDLTLKALQLDDSQAEAHTLLAGAYAWNDWNWNRAELEYRGAVQLAPQSAIAHQYYGSFLGALGRQDEAEAQMREAMRLDPLDTLLQWGEAQLMHWRGQNREAQTLLLKLEKQDPDFGLTAQLLAQVDWELGKNNEAEAALRSRLAAHPMDPLPLGQLGYTLAKSGRTGEARKILEQLQEGARQSMLPAHAIAFVFIGLGDYDNAVTQLSLALDQRAIRAPWLRIEPVYNPLRQNPRFVDLLRRANLQTN